MPKNCGPLSSRSPCVSLPPASHIPGGSVPLRAEVLLAPSSPQPLWPETLLSQSLCCCRLLTVRPRLLPGATPGAGLSAHKQNIIILSPSSAPSLAQLPQPHTLPPAARHIHAHPSGRPPPAPFSSHVFLVCPGTVSRRAGFSCLA